MKDRLQPNSGTADVAIEIEIGIVAVTEGGTVAGVIAEEKHPRSLRLKRELMNRARKRLPVLTRPSKSYRERC